MPDKEDVLALQEAYKSVEWAQRRHDHFEELLTKEQQAVDYATSELVKIKKHLIDAKILVATLEATCGITKNTNKISTTWEDL